MHLLMPASFLIISQFSSLYESLSATEASSNQIFLLRNWRLILIPIHQQDDLPHLLLAKNTCGLFAGIDLIHLKMAKSTVRS